jgi:murein L,D-transpeptidase YafK
MLIASLGAAKDKPEMADKVLILKSERRLQLLHGTKVLKEYKVALGSSPIGAKEREGDAKTPEGEYVIDYRNPNSQFHRALHVSYPNQKDRERARKAGVDPGGMIMIHGLGKEYGWVGKAHTQHDWTLGCIAVTNEEIDEIWTLVPDRTPVEIRP